MSQLNFLANVCYISDCFVIVIVIAVVFILVIAVVPGDPLRVEEADVGCVEGADEVDPGTDIRLLVDTAQVRTHLQSINQTINQPTNQPKNNRPINQSINQPTNQPTNQSINQPINQ